MRTNRHRCDLQRPMFSVFNPTPRIERVPIAPGHDAFVIDDALTQPMRWVALAAQHREAFASAPHNAYPGGELRLPDALSERLDAFFATHVRGLLGARRTLRMYSRLALATRQPSALEPRQWICHRDRLDTAADRLVAACVLYLFEDPALGGTVFFTPKRDAQATAVLVHESGALAPAAFAAKYGIVPGYMTASNTWFERTGAVAARFNRIVFYDGGAVFHGGDIGAPERLCDDPRRGRLTMNGFFVCRRGAAQVSESHRLE